VGRLFRVSLLQLANGVLEVAMPLPAAKELPKPRHVEVQDVSTEKKKSAA
jgi:hypothetical protein